MRQIREKYVIDAKYTAYARNMRHIREICVIHPEYASYVRNMRRICEICVINAEYASHLRNMHYTHRYGICVTFTEYAYGKWIALRGIRVIYIRNMRYM